jgi:hypothetical protein
MSTLSIAEFRQLGKDDRIQAVEQPPLAEQTVTVSGTSAQSSAFNDGTRIIRVHTDAIVSILIGSNPTATTAKARMVAGQTEYFTVVGGHKIAAITNT